MTFSIMAGYGESTQLRGQSYESVVGDIEDLANELGVDKFYIAAVSGGGPYALAAASMIPVRLKGLLLLSAAGSPGVLSLQINLSHQHMMTRVFDNINKRSFRAVRKSLLSTPCQGKFTATTLW